LRAVFYSLREAKQAGQSAEVSRLSEQFRDLQTQAEKVVVPNEFGATLQRAGAVGLNAATSHDATKYYASLPANKLELWFALEAERFQVNLCRMHYM
jgi:predicted Zn-dependent peptidase